MKKKYDSSQSRARLTSKKRFEEEMKRVRDGVQEMKAEEQSYHYFSLGIVMGVVGGLYATVVDRTLSSMGSIYNLAIILGFPLFAFYIKRCLRRRASDFMSETFSIRPLISAIKERINLQKTDK